MAEPTLTISTVTKYFKEDQKVLEDFTNKTKKKLVYYQTGYPFEICLNSSYRDVTLRGTLSFSKQFSQNYPIYTGTINSKSTNGSEASIDYYATLEYRSRTEPDVGNWIFRLDDGDSEIIEIGSQKTTSLDPTSTIYDTIDAPTYGACNF